MKKRSLSLDTARGIAIISVILGHLGNADINRVVFTYHLPVFFLITGWFVNDRRPLGSFIKRKAQTLLLPYLAACIAMILSGIAFGYLGGGTPRALENASNWLRASVTASGMPVEFPFQSPAIGALWFLWATFWGSILLRLTLKLHPALRLGIIAALFAIACWSKTKLWLPFSIQTGCGATLFIYIGWLARQAEEQWKKLSWEIKAFAAAFALWVWIAFIRDFRSFWLVQLDLGRGVIDIFGSLCAAGCVFIISFFLSRRLRGPASFLAYFGRYSILMLCVHIVELNTFPWHAALEFLYKLGAPEEYSLYYLIFCKLLLDLGLAACLSRIDFIRALFGLAEPESRKTDI